MRWWIGLAVLLGVASAIAGAVVRACSSARVKDSWLRDLKRRDGRNAFHGVSIRWPINKLANDQSAFNARRLRRRA